MLLIGADQGLDILDAVAERMATAMGWDDERRALEIERYKTTVANSRLFR